MASIFTARSKARRFLIQAIYQWQMAQSSLDELTLQYEVQVIEKSADVDYFNAVLAGVLAEVATLDEAIIKASGRPLDEMTAIALAGLRLGCYELMHRVDVPYQVVLDESVSLQDRFGAVEGRAFVNGVLEALAKLHRDTEYKQQ